MRTTYNNTNMTGVLAYVGGLFPGTCFSEKDYTYIYMYSKNEKINSSDFPANIPNSRILLEAMAACPAIFSD